MHKKIRLLLTLFLLSASAVYAESNETLSSQKLFVIDANRSVWYEEPTAFGWITNTFDNIGTFGSRSFSKDNLGNLALIAASSAVLIHYDQDITNSVQKQGVEWGIDTGTSVGSPSNYPKTTGDFLYFLGDGRVPLTTAVLMSAYGYQKGSIRSLSTGSQLLEMYVSVGIVVQGVKISTGRSTPIHSETDGGEWNGPTDVKEYFQNTSKYDAMPSGHMATAVGMVTVLAENYYEHKTAIYTTGGIALSLLGWQMVNNGVHWAGDYPLAVAIGYGMGKVIYDRNANRLHAKSDKPYKNETSFMILPTQDGAKAVVEYRF